MEAKDSTSGWFFSPPVGASISNAALEDILEQVRRDDDHWSIEAPAPKTTTAARTGHQLSTRMAFLMDCGPAPKFISSTREDSRSVCVVRTSPTTQQPMSPRQVNGWMCPPTVDAYPVLSDVWEEFLEVSRQGNRYRYPIAVTLDRDQLTSIISAYILSNRSGMAAHGSQRWSMRESIEGGFTHRMTSSGETA
jgi:hypothetical protein